MTQLLRTRAAAEYLGVSESYMAKLRISGDGPRWSRLGRKIVIYHTSDLDQFARSNLRRSTSPTADVPPVGPMCGRTSDERA